MTNQFTFALDITVSVVNVGGDEDFLVRPGEDIEMVATVTGNFKIIALFKPADLCFILEFVHSNFVAELGCHLTRS